MSEWIDVEIELPPCDGKYEITNKPDCPSAEACLYYDGIGFMLVSVYRPVRYWRKQREMVKKYGKINA